MYLRWNSIEDKEIAEVPKVKQNRYPRHKSYIKLHISSVTLCDLFSLKPLISAYWHEEEPLGCSVFAEFN